MARVRTIISEVLALTAATAAAATLGSACGGGKVVDGGDGGTPGFSSACEGGGLSLAGVRIEPPVDFLANRHESWPIDPSSLDAGEADDAGSQAPWTASFGETTGTACATASDREGCERRLADLRLLPSDPEACLSHGSGDGEGGFRAPGCYASYYVWTRGDEIGTAASVEERLALIGKVDTIEEALHYASARGYQVVCHATGDQGPNAEYRKTADGSYEVVLQKFDNCGKERHLVRVVVAADGSVTETSRELLPGAPDCVVSGRRPDGLRLPPASCGDTTGAYLARMAALEAASVAAFRRLRRELRALGAPDELLGRAREAAKDEIRHARAVRALAAPYGAPFVAPEIVPSEARELLAVALENAREGCVRETYGALLAHVQAARAEDPAVRDAMKVIAEEETRHAELSWDVATWLDGRLDEAGRARVRRERARAIAELDEELAQALPRAVADAVGMPSPTEARALFEALAARLFPGAGEEGYRERA
jgi:hypothetical protein